ncbi:hypothetical protein [Chitinophaga sancti]|uniref:Oxidase n=1 Tax=Chitinophaga sancti TaxID=1004 RepID=A0A1K1LPU4_9BACT|nr:hypothetical protein [Chitinophaga sancti]WQD64945.1 hypothetical protein U0033_11120 [Chitinophaga sancti]WQG89431.1 hypothetical protein SR876_31350 [Chitinophaga sancti]SFW12900.1 hypothetical protein SAMN05661012_00116 [Chitinophaga sancti]
MKDILYNNDLDLDILNGDFVTGFSDLQHQKILLMNNRATFKEYPDTGVDAFGFLNDNDYRSLLAEIRNQFIADGMVVHKITLADSGQLNIDASYEDS